MSAATVTSATDKITYRDLYERWEAGNWSATQLDFTQDKHDWDQVFTEHERNAAIWNYSLFHYGEDSVADNLSPYIDAAPHPEQQYFLTTQQVDEARHAVFFARFMSEVAGRGHDVESSLAATEPILTWGFKKTFDRLDKMADELRADRSRPQLAKAITLYHIVIEATLAVPGQHFIEEYVTERGILPGFAEGMRNVSKDEQRHIGFGVKMLHDLQQEDPDCKAAVAELLREVMPYTVGVFIPPNWDETFVTCFGKEIEDIFEDGMASLDQKMRTAGMPLEELDGVPIRTDIPVRQRAEETVAMMRANLLGEKFGPPGRDRELLQIYFDTVRTTLDTSSLNGDTAVIQWDFADLEPWHIRIDNGNSAAVQGRVETADITLKCRFEDWVDITAGWEDPRVSVLKGKLRPAGKIKDLWRMRKVFPS
ncbi:MAG: ribonucleoside-diphosphate reductase beta chain [Thermoleophilaceae bacterium]|jgi:putative sterol carrier protein|nr:ribonucleoside-diphosphate reductase beta chain [Thermoleophilaceae bacterium]